MILLDRSPCVMSPDLILILLLLEHGCMSPLRTREQVFVTYISISSSLL